jgi:hypothetical protein
MRHNNIIKNDKLTWDTRQGVSKIFGKISGVSSHTKKAINT